MPNSSRSRSTCSIVWGMLSRRQVRMLRLSRATRNRWHYFLTRQIIAAENSSSSSEKLEAADGHDRADQFCFGSVGVTLINRKTELHTFLYPPSEHRGGHKAGGRPFPCRFLPNFYRRNVLKARPFGRVAHPKFVPWFFVSGLPKVGAASFAAQSAAPTFVEAQRYNSQGGQTS